MSACYSYSSGLLTYSSSNRVPEHMQVVFDDSRLNPIRAKVEAGERLPLEDGVTLYRTADILALGYLANLVPERLHGSRTYFNVNRHINPTDVCVASCRLCAFGKRVRDPKAYTMSLEEVWQRAGEGWSEAVTEFHIVGGLHPELTLDWFCEMLRGLKRGRLAHSRSRRQRRQRGQGTPRSEEHTSELQ